MRETIITSDQVKKINKIYDVFLNVYDTLQSENQTKIVRKILGKIHLISLTSIFEKVIDEDIDLDIVKDWLISFYGTGTRDVSGDERYNEFARGRVAVTEEAVKLRRDILMNSFEDFLDKNK